MAQKFDYPLSNQQKSIWYIEQVHPNTSIGIVSGTIRFTGNFNLSLLTGAIKTYIAHEENLRTRLKIVDSEPQQYRHPYETKEIDHYDLTQATPQQVDDWNATCPVEPFELIDSDLYYFATFQLKEDSGGFLIKVHHIISDGWSIVKIANQVMKAYGQLLKGQNIVLEYSPPYTEYLTREKQYLSSAQFEKDSVFWADAVKKLPEQVELKGVRTTENTLAQRKSYLLDDTSLVSDLKEFCKVQNISLFSLFFSVLSIYVHRITGRNALSFGTPVLNRKNLREKNTIGMFISALPLILEVDEDLDFITFNKEITRCWFSVLRHQQYPYERIFKDAKNALGPIRRLYDITISYQNAMLEKDAAFEGVIDGTWYFCGRQIESLIMHINEREADGTICIDYDYLVDVFSAREIERMHRCIMRIAADVLQNPGKKIKDMELMSAEEKDQILRVFNSTQTDYNKTRTIHGIIEEHAEKLPNATAVLFEGRSINYAELNEKAGALAAHLIECGLQEEDVVGVLLDRSCDTVVAILGILKAGGAFLPIDPAMPNGRISYMLADSKAAFVLVNEAHANRFAYDNAIKFEQKKVICINEQIFGSPKRPVRKITDPGALAYVIYTSGSTGEPKGVMVEHSQVVNFHAGLCKAMNMAAGRSVVSIASVGFDVFVFEIIPSLMSGLKIILAGEKEQKDPLKIADLIYTYNVNKLYITPSRLRVMLADNATHKAIAVLDEILCGGEDFPKDLFLLLKYISKAQIFNQYGPTETTIGVTIKNIQSAQHINIGAPMANTRAYVLDKNMQVMPLNAVGEIYIGGDCLSRGYTDAAYTAEKFVPDPYISGELIYRTGDMARWLPGGELMFLGRKDNQIKIRGYRVELSEIEKQLMNIKEIKNAAVIDRTDKFGNKYLCAYYISSTPISANQIKQHLHVWLPQYMIPAFYIRLPAFPLSVNGKLDTAALPPPPEGTLRKNKYAAPANPVEQQLLEIWQKNLGQNEIGVTDNYFTLGGDSLSMVLMLIDINKAFDSGLSFNHLFEAPTIRSIAKTVMQLRSEKMESMQKAPKLPYYPLSSSQQRLYILNGIDQNKMAYNMSGAFVIQGKLDVARLEKVFKTIFRRHEIFRTSFELMGNDIIQAIHEEVPFEIEKINASSVPEAARHFIRPFDLSKAPLFRAGVMNMPADKTLLLLDMHHIISDGASSALLMEEIHALYSGAALGDVAFQYKDYVMWSQKNRNIPVFVKQREYWLNEFKDNIPVLELPLDFPRPPAVDFKGNKMRFALDKAKTANVVKFCKENDISLFMFLFSVWNIFLSKISGQDDIVVGTPSLGRHYPDLDKIMGVFINTLPIRSRPEPHLTYRKFLEDVKKKTLNALDNQDYPYDQLMDILPIKRDLSRNPLFDTLFVYQNVNVEQMKIGNLSVMPEDVDIGISKLDLTLEAMEYNEKLHMTFEYATSLFEEKTIVKFISYIETLVNNILLNPDEKLHNIECITETERQLLLNEYNKTAVEYPPLTLDQIFDKIAADNPEKPAVVFHDEKITFAQLKKLSDQIAGRLIQAGVGKGNIVGLLCHRSIEMIAGLFGIMKSGAAYMPIEPDYPEERQKYMLQDSDVSAIVYSGNVALPVDFEGISLKIDAANINEQPTVFTRRHKIDDCIYVLYTSGSTGKPKGVMIRHKSIVNFFVAMKQVLPLKKDTTVLCSTTFCFDVFALEAIIPLSMGLTIVMADEEQQRLPWLMADLIIKNDITLLQATPSRMRVLLEDWNIRTALKRIEVYASVGEAMPLALLKKLQSITPARIFDLYGPTETTVYSTVSELTHADHVQIGRPLANTQVYILSEHMRLLPPGAVGELYIGGDGVAIGYINNPDLTAERFVPDPFKSNARIYKTGDLVRYEKDGNILYLGRRDNQIKVRGFRIELGEIENCMMSSGMVTQAIVMPVYSNDEIVSLCAYITAQDAYCDIIILKQHIAKYLPEYMVPSQYIILDKVPLTGSGKVDRKALPKPELNKQGGNNVVFPTNDTEKELFDIWAKVLKNDNISIDRSFFELGGDSLSVIIVQMQYYKKNFHLSTNDFYRYQTIAEQADIIRWKGQRKEYAPGSDNSFPSLKDNPASSGPPRLKNILISGATGFLGAHIVREIIKNTGASVYCIIRGDNPDYHLSEALKYYHGMPFVNKYKKRIFTLGGDITKPRLGLAFKDYDELALHIDTVIHCAADVRHFGRAENFYATNVEGTNQIIEFTAIAKAHLFHVSTISVAGSQTNSQPIAAFTEKDFFVGQDYHENEYVKSKFEAERMVIDAMHRDIHATILRIGNLTGRYRDGVFQKNIYANAFYQRLKAFIMLASFPEKYKGMQLEFTPVDVCAKAVLTIISAENTLDRVYHLKNQNMLSMSELVAFLNLDKNGFVFVDEKLFLDRLKECAKEEGNDYAAAFMQDLDENGRISFGNNVEVASDITIGFLKQQGFIWPKTDKRFIKKVFRYMRNSNFISEVKNSILK
jgi:amino acid adenylation domain-containing protein/thioester reductase-like protein